MKDLSSSFRFFVHLFALSHLYCCIWKDCSLQALDSVLSHIAGQLPHWHMCHKVFDQFHCSLNKSPVPLIDCDLTVKLCERLHRREPFYMVLFPLPQHDNRMDRHIFQITDFRSSADRPSAGGPLSVYFPEQRPIPIDCLTSPVSFPQTGLCRFSCL